MITFVMGLQIFTVTSLGVAAGLALFQYIVLPIGNGIARLKELVDERGTTKR